MSRPLLVNAPFPAILLFACHSSPVPEAKTDTSSSEPACDEDAATVPLPGEAILGRPTDTSVTLSLRVDEEREIYVEYGPPECPCAYSTPVVDLGVGVPSESVLGGLSPDVFAEFRVRHRAPGESSFASTEPRTFHTRRAPGSAFTFIVQADPHYLDPSMDLDVYQQTLSNEAVDAPDFVLDLGDTFMGEKYPTTSLAETEDRYVAVRALFSQVADRVPLFLVNGNHEGELGWKWEGTTEEIACWATIARQTWFLNPVPDAFYSGNSTTEPLFGLRENYYAWEWGDALFIVLDPYWYTVKNANDDLWLSTLGDDQYYWLEGVLQASTARFKFVFSHHVLGADARGGALWSDAYEWGGQGADGTWAFDAERPGWALPIRQLLVENGVSVFFQGHDHLFAREEVDGLIYQTVPQPSDPNYKHMESNQVEEYGYLCEGPPDCQSNSGHLRVTVTPEKATVEYVRAFLPEDENAERVNGRVYATYDIQAGD